MASNLFTTTTHSALVRGYLTHWFSESENKRKVLMLGMSFDLTNSERYCQCTIRTFSPKQPQRINQLRWFAEMPYTEFLLLAEYWLSKHPQPYEATRVKQALKRAAKQRHNVDAVIMRDFNSPTAWEFFVVKIIRPQGRASVWLWKSAENDIGALAFTHKLLLATVN